MQRLSHAKQLSGRRPATGTGKGSLVGPSDWTWVHHLPSRLVFTVGRVNSRDELSMSRRTRWL